MMTSIYKKEWRSRKIIIVVAKILSKYFENPRQDVLNFRQKMRLSFLTFLLTRVRDIYNRAQPPQAVKAGRQACHTRAARVGGLTDKMSA